MGVEFGSLPETRSSRQELIEWWDQDRLASARVVVAGAGAVGNEALKLLALLGVGSIIVIDFDTVSITNLSRTVLFRPEDVGKPKASLAAERVRDLNPEIHVAAIDGDVGRDLGLATLSNADVVLGCLDSVNARWILNRRCWLAGVPWINAGISASEVQVTRYVPGAGACYECTFSPGMSRRFNERYSCTGLVRRTPERAVPTTAVGASIAAALQVNDAVHLLHASEKGLLPGHRLTVLLDSHRQFVDGLPDDEACAAHRSVGCSAVQIKHSADVVTPGDLVDAVDVVSPVVSRVELGFDLIESFECRPCGETEVVCRPALLVFEDEITCPRCGVDRLVHRVSDIGTESPGWTRTLASLGVSDRDVLRVASVDVPAGIWVEVGGKDHWLRQVEPVGQWGVEGSVQGGAAISSRTNG